LIDPNLIDQIVEIALYEKLDYVSNVLIESFPDGQDIEVVSFKALKKCFFMSELQKDKEHVTPYIKRNSTFNGAKLFSAKNIISNVDYKNVRMTVDEKIDLLAIKTLIERFGDNKDWKTYAQYIVDNQNLFSNQKILRNQGY